MQDKPPAAAPELGQFRLRSECISRFSQCVNKMEIRYRETRSDFIRWHRLNKTHVMSQWRSYLMVALALLPTSLLLLAYQATYAALWMTMAGGFMLAWAGYRYYVPLVRFPLSEHTDVFDRHVGKRKTGNSIGQWKWERIEEARETGKDFQFWRNDIASILPKRALSPDQQNEMRILIKEAQERPAGDSPPLPLYQERILSESQFPVYRYQMSSTDASQITGSRLRPYERDIASVAQKSRSAFRRWLSFLFGLVLCFSVLVIIARAGLAFPGLGETILICALPFFILWLYVRLRTRLKLTRVFKLPSDEISARLCHDGIVMGSSDYVALLHWNDVTAFWVNDHFIGFRTIHSLIHLLPMRVIGGEAEVERFLETAAGLKDVADREAAVVVQSEPVQSDNPYQPPAV